MQPRLKTFAWWLLRLDLDTVSRIHRIIPSIAGTCSQYRFASSVGLRCHALPSSGRGVLVATLIQHSQI